MRLAAEIVMDRKEQTVLWVVSAAGPLTVSDIARRSGVELGLVLRFLWLAERIGMVKIAAPARWAITGHGQVIADAIGKAMLIPGWVEQ